MTAREVVRGRERLAVGGVRLLLGHRREPPRAPRDDAPEGAWLATELARDGGPVVHRVTVAARPGVSGRAPRRHSAVPLTMKRCSPGRT